MYFMGSQSLSSWWVKDSDPMIGPHRRPTQKFVDPVNADRRRHRRMSHAAELLSRPGRGTSRPAVGGGSHANTTTGGGYTGAVSVTAGTLPAGVTASTQTIAAGATTATVTLTAASTVTAVTVTPRASPVPAAA